MKPAPFAYFAPESSEEALSLLEQHGDDAKLLAGGQSLIPTMNFRLAQPAVLIDLNRIGEPSYIRESADGIVIGAMTRQRMLEKSDLIKAHLPLVYETMPHIAHVQIRNRGTVGGNLAHADPASELPAVMTTLQATFKINSAGGERRVPVNDFYIGMYATTLQPEEMLSEIIIPPLPPRTGWAFEEIARRHGDYALVGVAVLLTLDDNSRCQQARIVYLSVGDGPVVAEQAAALLQGQSLNDALLREAAEVAAQDDIDPEDDIHASAAYRRQLAKVLTERALKRAFSRIP